MNIPHKLAGDMKKALSSSQKVKLAWDGITLLARNEWICWIESAKKKETRQRRIERMLEELGKGKKRPCCWAGCSHR